MKEFLRWLGLITGWPVQLLFFKKKVYYEDPSVQKRFVWGGALIVSNHYHVFDYMVNLFLFPFRKLYVVLKSDVFANPFLRWSMTIIGGIRSDRDEKGLRFIDEGVMLLRKGKIIQIYPEAYITGDGNLLPFKTGYILMAQRGEVPIIPVVTDGNYGFFKRVHLMVGKPIYLYEYCNAATPNGEQIAALNAIVYDKVSELKARLEQQINDEKRR